jgi:hypothetical protein
MEESRDFTSRVIGFLSKDPVLYNSIQLGLALAENEIAIDPAYRTMKLYELIAVVHNRLRPLVRDHFPEFDVQYECDYYAIRDSDLSADEKTERFTTLFGQCFQYSHHDSDIHIFIMIKGRASDYGYMNSLVRAYIESFLTKCGVRFEVYSVDDGDDGKGYTDSIRFGISPLK